MSLRSAICFVVIFVLLLSVFTLSAFASSSDLDHISDTSVSSSSVPSDSLRQSLSTLPSSSGFYRLPDSEILLATSGSSSWYGYTMTGEVYVCYVLNYNGYQGPTFLSHESDAKAFCRRNGTNTTVPELRWYDSELEVYYNPTSVGVPSGGTPETTLPVYSTINDALQAFSDYSPTPLSSFNYSLPPGNAIYISVPASINFSLKTRMPESVLGSNHYPGNNQVVTLVSSLPSGGSAPSSPLIPWEQDGALSVLGLSRNASYSGSTSTSGYLCIVNPLYYSGTANGPYEFLSNGSIEITVQAQSGFRVYPLDSSLGFNSGLGINVDTDILDTPYDGEIDPETGEIIWTDSSGGNSEPTMGGGNLVSTSETIFDFLRNIGDEISVFLKGPIQAVQTVVSSIREFMGSFTQLYMWLPAPVYNLITSALMIALTIGVIKIFV